MMRKFATIFSALVLTAGLARGGDSSAGVRTDQVRATVRQSVEERIKRLKRMTGIRQ
jgi:hypothetical protein